MDHFKYYHQFIDKEDLPIFEYWCRKKRKKKVWMYLSWIVGLHYLYLQKPSDLFMFWARTIITGIICYLIDPDYVFIAAIWWVVSLFYINNVFDQVQKHRAQIIYYDFETNFERILKYYKK